MREEATPASSAAMADAAGIAASACSICHSSRSGPTWEKRGCRFGRMDGMHKVRWIPIATQSLRLRPRPLRKVQGSGINRMQQGARTAVMALRISARREVESPASSSAARTSSWCSRPSLPAARTIAEPACRPHAGVSQVRDRRLGCTKRACTVGPRWRGILVRGPRDPWTFHDLGLRGLGVGPEGRRRPARLQCRGTNATNAIGGIERHTLNACAIVIKPGVALAGRGARFGRR